MSELPRLTVVGYIRVSRDLRTLVLTVGDKVFLANVEGVQEMIVGHRRYAYIVEGKKFENPSLETIQETEGK